MPSTSISSPFCRAVSSLRQSDVACGLATVTTAFEVEGHGLTIVKLLNSGAFKSGNMNKNVPRSLLGSNETKTFLSVEPFHGAIGHRVVSIIDAIRNTR